MGTDVFAIHDAIAESSDVKDLYTGNCQGCGECCSRILPMSERDIERLHKHIRKHGIQQTPERGDIDMVCPYLTESRECAVYHARPDICRAYRCDRQVANDYSLIRKFMTHPPYKVSDMREVA